MRPAGSSIDFFREANFGLFTESRKGEARQRDVNGRKAKIARLNTYFPLLCPFFSWRCTVIWRCMGLCPPSGFRKKHIFRRVRMFSKRARKQIFAEPKGHEKQARGIASNAPASYVRRAVCTRARVFPNQKTPSRSRQYAPPHGLRPLAHLPRVKSGNACGMPPMATDCSLSVVIAI